MDSSSQVTCGKGHALQPVNTLKTMYPHSKGSYANNRYNCDACKIGFDCTQENSYHCTTCQDDMCPNCYNKAHVAKFGKPSGALNEVTCLNQHALSPVKDLKGLHPGSQGTYSVNGFVCDKCKGNFQCEKNEAYHCRECKYDLCGWCYDAKQVEVGDPNRPLINLRMQSNPAEL